MTAFADDRTGWLVARARFLAARIGQLELLDRAYTLAAQSFVTLLPLILALAAALESPGQVSVVAEQLIVRFDLVGSAAQAVQSLIVVHAGRVYWLGLALTLYAAFTLAKRASRSYNAIWGTPQLPLREQWRGVVWLVVQLAMMGAVTELRQFARESGTAAAIAAALLILLAWAGAELVTQTLVTRGDVPRRRMLLAVAFVTVGRLGLVVWTASYLSVSMVRQAEAYGPIGVVFALFTGLLVYWSVLLGATLLAAVLTDPQAGLRTEPAPRDRDVAQGDF